MKYLLKASCLILSLLALPLSTQVLAQDLTHPRDMEIPKSKFKRPDPAKYQVSLDNGLVAYVAKEHQVPLVSLSAFIKAGKIDGHKEGAAEALAEEMPEQFDVVTCLEMLEHVPDPASVIRACFRMVKPGGQVFFSTINRNPKAYLFAIIGAEYVMRLLPRGTHDFKKFIRPSELGAWSREAGLEVKDIIGLTYNPLSKRYKLEADVDVNYMIQTLKEA